MNAHEIISLLNLKPVPGEGGYYRETYRSEKTVLGGKNLATAIYYMITKTEFSALHRIPQDEVFHFYMGDPVRFVEIGPEGALRETLLGPRLQEGQVLQKTVPGGSWQGLRVVEGGSWALLGAQVFPGFDFKDFEVGDRETLLSAYPGLRETIVEFSR